MGTTRAPERKWLASDKYRRILHPRSATQILQMQVLLIWISPIKVRDIFTFHLIMSLCQTGMSVPGTGYHWLSACRRVGPSSIWYRRGRKNCGLTWLRPR